jgi:hypothetical protein
MREIEPLNDSFRLLLIYKDQLADDTVAGSPLISTSRTIALHLYAANPSEDPKKYGLGIARQGNETLSLTASGQLSLFEVEGGNPRYPKPIPEGTTVWGWWRKPWENHHLLFQRLREATTKNFFPRVLLYNQYVRRLYHATLHDIYFETGLTTVVVPSHWAHACPVYYRDRSHLCGAFFVLAIDLEEKDANELNSLFVDSTSFEGDQKSSLNVIPPSADVGRRFREMIDGPPTRANLRTVELTMFLLRAFRQRDTTARLLASTETNASLDIAKAFRETEWSDLLAVLRDAAPSGWEMLSQNPEALLEVGYKAQANHSRLTRLDFELFADAVSNRDLGSLLKEPERTDEFSALGSAIRKWLTEENERNARQAAAEVFRTAWSVAMKRYQLAELPESYFDSLPAMEAIANAVKHELGRKFYRDHLSHNVRAALLTARILGSTSIPLASGMNGAVIGFFSGLLHDLSLPLTTFPDTIGKIAGALTQLQEARDGRAIERVQHTSIVDRDLLKKSLSYVAMLASVPSLPTAFLNSTFKPWEAMDEILQIVNNRLLFEEMLCATSYEHAIISAALVFDYAVRGLMQAPDNDFDTAVRTLLLNLTGPTASATGRELTCILQSMALHDRRAAAEHHGVAEPPKDTPQPLDLERFAIPALVSIADEFQEWGRTLGALNEIGAVDAKIQVDLPLVHASFTLASEAHIFARVPFSLLEYVLGKYKTIGRFRLASGNALTLKMRLENLSSFIMQYTVNGADCRIDFLDPYDQIDFGLWPGDPHRRSQIRGPRASHLIAIMAADPAAQARDFILASGRPDVLAQLEKQAKERIALESFAVDLGEVTFRFVDGIQIKGSATSYHFGVLALTTTPANRFPKGKAGVLEIEVKSAGLEFTSASQVEREPQETPFGHFLDFDWRFTSRTCKALVEFARHTAKELGGEICYLGCPSVAIWHAALYPSEANWMLLDRGHYALNEWLGRRIPHEKFIDYDVFLDLPPDCRHRFAIVLTDPPWYDPHYEIFCRRADQLLMPSGVLGVTYYPRSLDEGKYERFNAIIFEGAIRELRRFGALEIDYMIPEFEKPLQIFHKYEHPALGIYRPGFMDFYQAPDAKAPKPDYSEHSVSRIEDLGERISLGENHHMRCVARRDLDTKFPFGIKVSRKGIKRVREVPDDWLGITTTNMVVKFSDDAEAVIVKNVEELVQVIVALEAAGQERAIEEEEEF